MVCRNDYMVVFEIFDSGFYFIRFLGLLFRFLKVGFIWYEFIVFIEKGWIELF